ncbi:uncharacterized protein LOC115726459 [Rhodamnia argentea]|uniref:Uncharacterized protein LOC115726459 n=1 Tax=Rhodamnia argentea TaxID=178133 RepID=A0ABM3GXH5_9MYRT|nr:uncharacterized protein LOC115726459 [Rhodamnia argentea]
MEHPVSPATPPSLGRHNEALSQRMRNDICFSCNKQGHWMKDCPDKSPARSQPSAAASSSATPPSLDRHNEALSQRMRNDVCFSCNKQGHWTKDCPDKSPARSQPSAASSSATPPSLDRHNAALSQGMRNGVCFSCNKQGHWTKDCPDKSPARSQPSAAAASSSSTRSADVPVFRCPCGAGACYVCTSRTLRNPDRKFYRCPDRSPNGAGGCRFFAWCDKYSAPMCPCGAGRCSINIFEDPPHKGREYFSCRIKKGHGACTFFQWANSPAENMASRDAATSIVAPTELMEIESAMVDAGEDYEEDPLSMMDSGQIQEVICRFSAPERDVRVLEGESFIPEADLDSQELATEDVDLGESTTEQMQLVSCVTSPAAVCLRQQEHSRQISAAGGILAGSRDIVDMVFDRLGISWCGHLALPPCPSLADPSPTPSFCGNFTLGKVLVLNQIAKFVFKDVIDLFEKNSLDHGRLEQEARDHLDFLPVDSSQFKEQVKECLHCASRLAEVERPTNEPAIREHCDRAKRRFYDISEKHSVTSDACAACDGRITRLREDYCRAKETLLRIEAELHGCEVEHAELQGRLAEITREMEEAKSGMEEASLAVQRREMERCAARAALEKARLQLRSNLRKRPCLVTHQP